MNLLLLSLLTAASSWIDLPLVTVASSAVARLSCRVNGGGAAAACWRVATTASSPGVNGGGGGGTADDAAAGRGADLGRRAASSCEVASLPRGCIFTESDCLKAGPAAGACWLLAAATRRGGAVTSAAAGRGDDGCRSEAATWPVAITTCKSVAALGPGWEAGDAADAGGGGASGAADEGVVAADAPICHFRSYSTAPLCNLHSNSSGKPERAAADAAGAATTAARNAFEVRSLTFLAAK